MLDHVEPIVVLLASTDELTAHDHVDDLARRCLIRQWRTLADSSADDPARRAADLVGRAIDDLVLLRYLAILPRHDANTFVAARSRVLGADDRADDRGGAVRAAGSPDDVVASELLTDLAHRNGWPAGPPTRHENGPAPSTRWMAAASGELHVYDHLAGPRPRHAAGDDLDLTWAAILLCRTATAIRPLVRGVDLPSNRLLVTLMAECAAAVPTIAPTGPGTRPVAC